MSAVWICIIYMYERYRLSIPRILVIDFDTSEGILSTNRARLRAKSKIPKNMDDISISLHKCRFNELLIEGTICLDIGYKNKMGVQNKCPFNKY